MGTVKNIENITVYRRTFVLHRVDSTVNFQPGAKGKII